MPDETVPMGLGPPLPPVPAKQVGPKSPAELPSEQLNAVMARVRVSEERYGDLRKMMLVIEQNMIANHKKAMNEIKSLQGEMSEMKRVISVIEDKIITIIKELRLAARKEDIDVLKRYLELWDPVKFVTNEQVEKIVDEKLGLGLTRDHEPPRYDSP